MPLLLCVCFTLLVNAQSKVGDADGGQQEVEQPKVPRMKAKMIYGVASYYADKFNGRQTANGELYNHNTPSAACNVLPLGTWIRVTNVRNKTSVIVKVNDRLHPRMKRVVDLNKGSAEKLGYTKMGLAQVRVEVLGMKKPKDGVGNKG
jgi:rare lipoprotein A